MLYVENVPPVERLIRVPMGIGLLVAAVLWLGANTTGWIVGAMRMMAALRSDPAARFRRTHHLRDGREAQHAGAGRQEPPAEANKGSS